MITPLLILTGDRRVIYCQISSIRQARQRLRTSAAWYPRGSAPDHLHCLSHPITLHPQAPNKRITFASAGSAGALTP